MRNAFAMHKYSNYIFVYIHCAAFLNMQIVVVDNVKAPLLAEVANTDITASGWSDPAVKHNIKNMEKGHDLPMPVSAHKHKHYASVDASSSTILALTSYCLSSIGMTVLNKYVLSSHHFKLPFLLLTCQSAVCVLFLVACKQAELLKYRPFTRQEAIQWFPVSLLLIVMIYTGSLSLKYLTVAMFTVFKNVAIIFTAFAESKVFGNRVSPLMMMSFLLIVPNF